MLQRKHVKPDLFDKMHYWFDSLFESKNSKHEHSTACLVKAVKHTCILQATSRHNN